MRSRRLVRLTCGLLIALGGITACGKSPSGPSGLVASLKVDVIIPSVGIAGEASSVTIRGAGFNPRTTVVIGNVAATDVIVTSDTTLTVKTPILNLGIADVILTNQSGQTARLDRAFSVVEFLVNGIAPAVGRPGPGISVRGLGFKPGMTIRFGGLPAPIVELSSSSIMIAAPEQPSATTVDVEVVSATGHREILRAGFRYEYSAISVNLREVAAGGQVVVSWVAKGTSFSDWIGLYRVGSSNTEFMWWDYVGKLPGTRTVTMPTTPGQYEFRYLLNDGYESDAVSERITVTGATAGRAPGE